jgi:uncharacterized protein YraI
MNSLRSAILAGFGLVFATLTPAAAATSAFVGVAISERAGPSPYYPVVADVPSGAPVTLYGCLTGGSWCDVSYAGVRGWLPGSYVEAYYQSQPVFVPDYISLIAVPIIAFDIGVYWNDYYHDRPFFSDHARFERFARYAHGPGARVALAPVPGPRGPHGRLVAGQGPNGKIIAAQGPNNGKVIAGEGPRGANGRLIAGNVKPQTLAAVGAKHRRLIATNAPGRMIAAGGPPKGTRFAAGPMLKPGGGPHPQFAMVPRGGKACRNKAVCG